MAKKIEQTPNPFLNPTTPTTLPFEKPIQPVTPIPIKPVSPPINTGGGVATLMPSMPKNLQPPEINIQPNPKQPMPTGSINPIYDDSTLAGRLLNQGVSPTNYTIPFRLRQEMLEAQPVNREQMTNVNAPKPLPNNLFTSETENKISRLSPQLDLRNTILSRPIGAVAKTLEKFSSFLPSWANLGTSKSLEVKKAEAIFLDLSKQNDDNILLFQQGLISRADVQRDLDETEAAIVDLYRQTKGEGQADLRFWLDKGKEIEAQVQREISILNKQKAKLNAIPI